jgi:translation initiation factor IF-3
LAPTKEPPRRGNISRELRVNERIRVREVRVISDSGEQLGVMPTLEALRIARERNLDLVEVAPTAVPPVCRLMDFGKYKYEQTQKEREARRNQKVALLKEVRLTPKTHEHDLLFKSKMIQRFLEEGDKVKVTVRFKGREMAHPQLGKQALDTIVGHLKDVATLERTPLMEGRTMTMILAPAHGVAHAKAPAQVAEVAQPSEPAPSTAAGGQ